MLTETSVKYFDSSMVGGPTLNPKPSSLINILKACLVDGWTLGGIDHISLDQNELTLTCNFPLSTVKAFSVIDIQDTRNVFSGQYKIKELIEPNIIKCDCALNDVFDISGSWVASIASVGWSYLDISDNVSFFKTNSEFFTTGLVVNDTDAIYTSVMGAEDIDLESKPVNTFFHNGNNIPKSKPNGSNNDWFVVANRTFVYIGIYNTADLRGYRIISFGKFISKKQDDEFGFLLTGGGIQNDRNEFRGNTGVICCIESSIFCVRPTISTFSPVITRGLGEVNTPVKIATQAYSPTITDFDMHCASVKWSGLSNTLMYPNDAIGGLCLSKIYFVEDITKTLRGIVPGALFSPLNIDLQINIDPKKLVVYKNTGDTIGENILSVILPSDYYGQIGVGFIDLVGPWGN